MYGICAVSVTSAGMAKARQIALNHSELFERTLLDIKFDNFIRPYCFSKTASSLVRANANINREAINVVFSRTFFFTKNR
jgi:hypothetical protein